MNAKELIEILKQFDPEMEVKLEYDGCYNKIRQEDVFIQEEKGEKFICIF